MALVYGERSDLNPNAPLFIPAALRQVEDFSPEWWELVKTSTWFRDYWLSQHEEEDFGGNADADDDAEADDYIANMLLEAFDLGIVEELPTLEAQTKEMVPLAEGEGKTGLAPAPQMEGGLLMLYFNNTCVILLHFLVLYEQSLD
jgi:hypothetical protein